MRVWVPIEKNGPISLGKQVYLQIRNGILRGELRPGEKLASSRELAESLKVSRNVILEAYDLLAAEGYLYSVPHSGTFVATGTYLDAAAEFPLQESATAIPSDPEPEVIHFRPGIPALELLPRKKWSRIYQEVLLDRPAADFGYGYMEGQPELRHAICHYLRKHRGVVCEPDQIIITHGTCQSLTFLAKILTGPGISYIVEEPLHLKIRSVVAVPGGTALSVPVDEAGLQTALLPADANPAFVLVTPSHQYPLGGCMPIQRRIELVQYARSKDCLILEDDYDSEFRYEGPPISSLQGLDPKRVIYLGTFSKVLFPGLRLGYIVAPWSIWWRLIYCKTLYDSHCQVTDQLALARFIAAGWLERHIARMRKVYLSRRNTLINALHREFGNQVQISGKSTGLHLVVAFPGLEFTTELTDRLFAGGVWVIAAAVHATADQHCHGDKLIMGYSHLSPEEIETGVRRLGRLLANILPTPKG